MIRHFIIESGNHMIAPSITGVHASEISCKRHFENIRRNFKNDGYAIADNTDACFTVAKGEESTTFAIEAVRFD